MKDEKVEGPATVPGYHPGHRENGDPPARGEGAGASDATREMGSEEDMSVAGKELVVACAVWGKQWQYK